MKNHTSPTDVAMKVMNTLHQHLGADEPATAFVVLDQDCAVSAIGSDPYVLLSRLTSAHVQEEVRAIGVSSYGWAAPHDGAASCDVGPSEHPERRRVHLVCLITPACEMASTFRFLDTGEVISDELGSATGSLAQALREAARRVFSDEGNRNL